MIPEVWYLAKIAMDEVDLGALFFSSFSALSLLGLERLSWGFLFRTVSFLFSFYQGKLRKEPFRRRVGRWEWSR